MTASPAPKQILKKFHLHSPSLQKNNKLFNDLDQAIKKNNVPYFIKNSNILKYQNTPIQLENNNNLQQHLLILKKSCNQLYQSIKNKQLKTKKLIQQNLLNTNKHQKIKLNQLNIQHQISQLQKNLLAINKKKQIAQHSTKTYQHVLYRMKQDQVYYLLHKHELQQKIQSLFKNYSITKTQHFNLAQFQKQAQSGLKQAQHQLTYQDISRKHNLQTIQQQTQIKLDRQNKLKQRQKQTLFIQDLIADDLLDADLTKIKKFLTVQKFIRALLKSKIYQLKNYYQPYELAFLQIKTHSNVIDASTLKSQYFNYQTIYNDRIKWIKQLQQQLQQSQLQKKMLKSQLSSIKINQIQNIQRISYNKYQQSDNKSLLISKSLQYQLLYKNIGSWILIQTKKMKLSNNNNVIQMFKNICQKLKIDKQINKQNNTLNNNSQLQTH